ncbi:MAG TPA: hypothetical protein VFQ39_13350 [Longimicrobium sp.]|nr:hypothetical protein [Longimicrobium sp.]
MTRKLALRLDELEVESFATLDRNGARGTVAAHGFSIVDQDLPGKEHPVPVSGDISCDTCQTCDASMCDSCYLRTCGCAATEIG